MHTFAQKPKATQQTTSAKSTIPGRGHLGQSPEVRSILHLQRTIGNYAVQRMLQTDAGQPEAELTEPASPRFEHDFSRTPIHPPAAGAIQTKLAINKPGDSYEQEADHVAEQVMRTPDPQLQRACPCGGGCPKCRTEQPGQEHESLQTKCVQAADTGQIATPPTVHEVLRSPGQPLDPATRAFMEPRFGHDFSRVRVHTDSAAAESAGALNAAAYTVGRDLVFGTNRYAPDTGSGRELLGHELAHTIQQRDPSGPPPRGSGVLETSAAAAGRAVANGHAVATPLPATGVGISRTPVNEKTADAVVSEGRLWVEQHYSNAILTGTKVEDRAGMLTYSRALMNAEIEMSKAQSAHQQFAPVLDDLTESRIDYRRNALLEILRTKSVREGLSSARDRAKNAEELTQIRLVEEDVKLVQDEFRSRAYSNAYKLLDEGSREVATMLRSYGLMIARADDVVRFVRMYEGELGAEAAKWIERSRGADTSGYSEVSKSKHRADLSMTLKRLRALQHEVKRLKPAKHPVLKASEYVLAPIAPALSKAPESPELKRAKAELAGAWLNAELDHPVLAAYRSGKEDALEDVDLGRGGEKDDLQALVSQGIRILANILTAKLALQQGKVSPYELGPIVALTRAQMLIRRGSVWDVVIDNLMRGDEGEAWAKEALRMALGALILVFPMAWPLMLASAAINLHAAGTAYVRYGLDTALVGTRLDRAKAISTKTPSLAGLAWALIGAGLDLVGARAAFAEAQALRAKVLAGDEAAVAELNKLGEKFNVGKLGDDVAKTRPAEAPKSRPAVDVSDKPMPPTPRAQAALRREEEFVSGGGRPRRSISRPFHHKDPTPPRGRIPAAPSQIGQSAKPLVESGEELIARADALLVQLPRNHIAREEILKVIRQAQNRLGKFRITQTDARKALDEFAERLEAIEKRYPGAFSRERPVALAPPPVGKPPRGPGERVVVGALDDFGRATHVTGEIRPADLRTGTSTSGRVNPPGAGPGVLDLDELGGIRRGHLLAKLFGGSGTQRGNLMWLTEWVNNSPYKIQFENLIRRALRQGESVRFTILPRFRNARSAAPYEVEVWAETTAGVTIVPRQTIQTPGLRDLELPSVTR